MNRCSNLDTEKQSQNNLSAAHLNSKSTALEAVQRNISQIITNGDDIDHHTNQSLPHSTEAIEVAYLATKQNLLKNTMSYDNNLLQSILRIRCGGLILKERDGCTGGISLT